MSRSYVLEIWYVWLLGSFNIDVKKIASPHFWKYRLFVKIQTNFKRFSWKSLYYRPKLFSLTTVSSVSSLNIPGSFFMKFALVEKSYRILEVDIKSLIISLIVPIFDIFWRFLSCLFWHKPLTLDNDFFNENLVQSMYFYAK